MAGVRWATRPVAGTADLLDGEHDPRLGVVVVVADRDRPRQRRGVVGALRAGRPRSNG